MALERFFGKSKSKTDFPPEEEYVPAEKPADLARGLSLEAPKRVERAIDEYLTSWNQYAVENNVFIAEEKRALWKARDEAIELSTELHKTENPNEKKRLEHEFFEKLDEINGPLSEALEERVEENKKRLTKQATESKDSAGPISEGGSGSIETNNDEPTSKSDLNSLAETKTALQESVNHLEIHKKHESMKDEIDSAQEAYFHRLTEFQKERNSIGLIAEQFTPEHATRELKELRREWVQKRAALWRSQTETAEERLNTHPQTREEVLEGLTKYKGKGHFTAEQIKARYERASMVRANILGREEAEQNARIQGLSERDKTWIDRQLERYKKLPPGVRIIGTSATLFGAGAFLAGSGIGAAALLLGGTSASLRWFAEAKKSDRPALSKVVGLLASFTSVSGILGRVSEGTAYAIHHARGTELKAKERLAKKEGFGDLSEDAAFEKLSTSRAHDLTAKQRVAKQGRVARTLGSLVGGFVVGHAVNELDHSGGGSDLSNHGNSVPDAQTGTTPPTGEDAGLSNHIQSEKHVSDGDGVRHMVTGSTIDQPGEGTDRLFADLKTNIEQNGLFKGSESPALKHFLDSNPDALSREMGEVYGTHGMVTHAGDQFFVDEHQNIYFQPKGGDAQIFIENKPDGAGHEYTIHHKFTGQPLAPNPEASAPAPEQTLEQASEPTPAAVSSEETAIPAPEASAPEAVPPAPEATPAPEVPASESDAFPRNPYLTTPDDTVPTPEASSIEAPPASTESDAFPKNPYLTPPEETPAVPETSPVEPAPAPEVSSTEPSSAPETISAPDQTRYVPDVEGNMIPAEDSSSIASAGTESLAPEVPTVEHPAVETPTSSTAPETVSAHEIPSESFTNTYNVTIDPSTPHAYEYVGTDGKQVVDAAGNKMYAMYGGTKDELAKAAEDFLRTHPDSSVRFQVSHTDVLTGTSAMRTLELGSTQGHVVMHPPSIFGIPLPAPDPKTFTGLVSYSYKPQ